MFISVLGDVSTPLNDLLKTYCSSGMLFSYEVNEETTRKMLISRTRFHLRIYIKKMRMLIIYDFYFYIFFAGSLVPLEYFPQKPIHLQSDCHVTNSRARIKKWWECTMEFQRDTEDTSSLFYLFKRGC
jgi:hypothetical protein